LAKNKNTNDPQELIYALIIRQYTNAHHSTEKKGIARKDVLSTQDNITIYTYTICKSTGWEYTK